MLVQLGLLVLPALPAGHCVVVAFGLVCELDGAVELLGCTFVAGVPYWELLVPAGTVVDVGDALMVEPGVAV